MWEAGNQVMLQADCKGKGQSKKLSKKWTGPYTIFEVRSPQEVLMEPNSKNGFTISVEQIKPFKAATPTTLNSSLKDGHYKVEEVLEELTTDPSWLVRTNFNFCWQLANLIPDWTNFHCPGATLEEHCGGESSGFSMEFQSPHSGNSARDELCSMLNKDSLSSSSQACGLSSHFHLSIEWTKVRTSTFLIPSNHSNSTAG